MWPYNLLVSQVLVCGPLPGPKYVCSRILVTKVSPGPHQTRVGGSVSLSTMEDGDGQSVRKWLPESHVLQRIPT